MASYKPVTAVLRAAPPQGVVTILAINLTRRIGNRSSATRDLEEHLRDRFVRADDRAQGEDKEERRWQAR